MITKFKIFEQLNDPFGEEDNGKERISIGDFIEDVKKVDEEFAEVCEEETPRWAIGTYLLGTLLDDFDDYFDWQRDKSFPYKLIEIIRDKEDGYAGTDTGIFQRKSDGKYFKLWVKDDGFLGPDTLTMCNYLEEVENKGTKRKRIWE